MADSIVLVEAGAWRPWLIGPAVGTTQVAYDPFAVEPHRLPDRTLRSIYTTGALAAVYADLNPLALIDLYDDIRDSKHTPDEAAARAWRRALEDPHLWLELASQDPDEAYDYHNVAFGTAQSGDVASAGLLASHYVLWRDNNLSPWGKVTRWPLYQPSEIYTPPALPTVAVFAAQPTTPGDTSVCTFGALRIVRRLTPPPIMYRWWRTLSAVDENAVPIVNLGAGPRAAPVREVSIYNAGTENLIVGASDVSATKGTVIQPGATWRRDVYDASQLYVRTESDTPASTPDVQVEFGA